MGYSTGNFLEFWDFHKMAITPKIEVGISSNFLHSISTSYASENVIKIWGDFAAIFWKKTMGYSTGNFSEFWDFHKVAITQKIEVGISSNFLHSISTSICIKKCNKNLG